MRGADAGLHRQLDAQLTDVERQTPEWRVLTGPLQIVLHELDHSAWSSPFPDPEAGIAPGSPGDPLLHGRTLLVDVRRLRRFVRRLTPAIKLRPDWRGSLGVYAWSDDQALRLLTAAIREDRSEIERLAAAARVDPAAVGTVGELAALPLLHSCGRLLQRIPFCWQHGYCPICGRWPVLAELRGLRGTRWLRCGRCGGDWQFDGLQCVYCGERDHEQLRSLAPEQSADLLGTLLNLPNLQVDTCNSCGGYLKTIATLQAIPPFELSLRDLQTLELDMVALERGYSRPSGSGFPLEIDVKPRAS